MMGWVLFDGGKTKPAHGERGGVKKQVKTL